MLTILFIVGYIIETILILVCKVDDYGYAKNKSVAWMYNFLHERDGLYDMPNIFFYIIVIVVSFKLSVLLFNILERFMNKLNK